MVYADDLVILVETFEGFMIKMIVWKNGLEIEGKHEENESHHFGKRSP